MTEQPLLSDFEHKIIECLSHGMSWPQTAKYMHTPLDQTKYRCRDMYKKLDAENGMQAIANAYERGLLPRDVTDIPDVIKAMASRYESVTGHPPLTPGRGDAR